ncbi:MAG: hypothetical protein PVI01_15540, partial [Gemmatimonadales bacterium]
MSDPYEVPEDADADVAIDTTANRSDVLVPQSRTTHVYENGGQSIGSTATPRRRISSVQAEPEE